MSVQSDVQSHSALYLSSIVHQSVMHTPNHLVAEPGCSSDITPNLSIASADLQASFSFDLSEFASVLSTSLNVADEIVVEPVTSVVLSGKPDLAELSAVLSILQSDQPGPLEGSAITSVVPSGQPFLAEVPASSLWCLTNLDHRRCTHARLTSPCVLSPKGKEDGSANQLCKVPNR